jgi:tRNA(fMet)-specific endonuclease VapC
LEPSQHLRVGLILDSSVLIAGERHKESVREVLKRVRSVHGEVDCALSVVTIVELTHGIYRAKSDADRERRRAFSEELRRDVVVHPVTVEIAELAGRIEGERAARGIAIAFEDLLIGATALYLGYGVATLNVRDFQKIPTLSVTQV